MSSELEEGAGSPGIQASLKAGECRERFSLEPQRDQPTHTFISSSKTLWTSVLQTAAAAKSLQSCPTLCDPIDGNPPGSPVPGILQARTLEWVAISFSNA